MEQIVETYGIENLYNTLTIIAGCIVLVGVVVSALIVATFHRVENAIGDTALIIGGTLFFLSLAFGALAYMTIPATVADQEIRQKVLKQVEEGTVRTAENTN